MSHELYCFSHNYTVAETMGTVGIKAGITFDDVHR